MKILGIIVAIISFLLLVVSHEFGHMIVGKLCGVRVDEFSVGMGPLIFKKQKGETQYSLRAIPLGGYCKFDEDAEESDDPRSFINASWWKRALILFAGAFMNFLVFLIIMLSVFMIIGIPQAKLSVVIPWAFENTFGICKDFVAETIGFFSRLFAGKAAAEEVVGIVGIVDIFAEELEYGFINVVYFMGIISLDLAFVNLLPFPALDGGRLLFIFIELITHNKVSKRVENAINTVGFMILMALAVMLIFKDTFNLILK